MKTDDDMNRYRSIKNININTSGFTLLEVALGLAIFGILLGGGLLVAGKLWERDRREEARLHLQQAKEAVLDFVKKNGRMPYADASGDGYEDPDTVLNQGGFGGGLWPIGYTDRLCNVTTTEPPNCFLPFKTLQITERDPFNSRLRYQVVAKLNPDTTLRHVKCSDLIGYFKSVSTLPILSVYDIDTNSYFGTIAVVVSSSEHQNRGGGNDTKSQFDGFDVRRSNGYVRFGQFVQGFLSPNKIDDQLITISPMELYEALQCGSPTISL